MRLALFTDTLTDINGVARFLADLRDAARQPGDQLRIFASTRKPLGPAEFAHVQQGSLVNTPPALAAKIPGYALLDVALPPFGQLTAAVQAFAPDIVHVSTPGPVGLCGRRFAQRHGVPLVGTYHTDFPAYARRIYGVDALGDIAAALTEWFYKPFDKLLVRSQQSADQLTAAPFALPPLAVLPPGIDLQRFASTPDEHADRTWRARIGLKYPTLSAAMRSGRPVVLSVGRISREKNMALLCKIWQRLAGDHATASPRPFLLLVGDGPGLAKLAVALHQAPLVAPQSHPAADVLLPGFATGQDLLDLYRCGSVLLFPSATDTLGQVTLEAQAMGVPAIVSDSGGPQRLIVPGVTGLVVGGQNPATWAHAVRSVTNVPGVLAAMRAAARAHAQTMPFERTSAAFWVEHRNVLARTHQAGPQSQGRGGAGR